MLPFVVAPSRTYEKVQVGNPEIGVLEIEKYGDLSPFETGFIKDQNLFNYKKELAKLAKDISREHGSHFAYTNDRINAYVFGGVIEGDTVKFEGKEATVVGVERDENYDISAVTIDIGGKEGKTQIVKTTLDQLELDNPDWYGDSYQAIQELSDLFVESLKARDIAYATAIICGRLVASWTIEQTSDPRAIHPALVKEIAQFAQKEKDGWEESKPEEPKPSTDEELGKSSKAATK